MRRARQQQLTRNNSTKDQRREQDLRDLIAKLNGLNFPARPRRRAPAAATGRSRQPAPRVGTYAGGGSALVAGKNRGAAAMEHLAQRNRAVVPRPLGARTTGVRPTIADWIRFTPSQNGSGDFTPWSCYHPTRDAPRDVRRQHCTSRFVLTSTVGTSAAVIINLWNGHTDTMQTDADVAVGQVPPALDNVQAFDSIAAGAALDTGAPVVPAFVDQYTSSVPLGNGSGYSRFVGGQITVEENATALTAGGRAFWKDGSKGTAVIAYNAATDTVSYMSTTEMEAVQISETRAYVLEKQYYRFGPSVPDDWDFKPIPQWSSTTTMSAGPIVGGATRRDILPEREGAVAPGGWRTALLLSQNSTGTVTYTVSVDLWYENHRAAPAAVGATELAYLQDNHTAHADPVAVAHIQNSAKKPMGVTS